MFPKFYPHLKGLLQLNQTAKGAFKDARPTGVTIHYTADRDIDRTARTLVQEGLGYHLLIDRAGEIYQMTSFDQKCWHAGKAVWAGESPNQSHVAIAIASWGYLTQTKAGGYKAWNNLQIPKSDVVTRPDNIKGVNHPWDTCTTYQFDALERALRWLMAQGMDPSHFCGHDECALPPGRKLDPGGVLPLTMAQLRKELKGGQPVA